MRCGMLARALALLCLAMAGRALADTVWIQSGSGNPIALSNIKVIGIQDDALVFTTPSGNQTSKPLKQVPQLRLDDEPAFSTAEEAFVAGKFAEAADNYHQAIQTTTKDWVKDRAALRLLEAANKGGNFPAAVAGFLDLLVTKPALAIQSKPAIPKDRPDLLDPVISEVKRASQNPKFDTARKQVLLNYLVELYNAKGDAASADSTLADLAKVAPAEANSPQAMALAADARLNEAKQAFGQKRYPQVIQTLESNAGLFTDAKHQADALYLIAQATAAGASPNDPNQLKDAALAYMRVVANCKGIEGQPHVAESLLQAAAIEEKLKNSKEALALYKAVAAEFKGSSAAAQAQREADRLGSAEAPKG